MKPDENKQDIKSIDGIFPNVMKTNEMKNEIDEIKKWKGKIKREGLKYETKRYIYDFYKYETIRYFGESIHSHESKTFEEEDQSNLLKNVVEFHNESRPKTKKGLDKKGRYL